MAVKVYYQGLRRSARLKGARFIGDCLYVTALIEGFRFEKTLRWDDIVKTNSVN